MNLKTYIVALFLVVMGPVLPGCKLTEGPLLINTSGKSVHLLVYSSDGTTFDGECADQSAVWAGKVKAEVTKIEVVVGGTKFELSGRELSVPYGKDPTTAFIIESTGPRKLAFDEAKILMRGK